MGTAIPKEELRAIVAMLTELPEANVVWDGEGEPFAFVESGTAGIITLNVAARRSMGVDEESETYPTPTTTKISTKGVRVLTISVRADQFDGDEGFDLLESLRTQLAFERNRDILRAAGVPLLESTDVHTLEYAVDNREISSAQFDIMLSQIVTSETTLKQSGYIEKVVMAGDPATDLAIVAEFEVDGSS